MNHANAMTAEEFDRTLASLMKRDVCDVTLTSCNKIAASIPASNHLIASVLNGFRSAPGTSQEQAVADAMELLEYAAEKSKCVACKLMACLLPHASDLYMHHVCDAISLWIADCRSRDLSNYLCKLASYQLDPGTHRLYTKLAGDANRAE